MENEETAELKPYVFTDEMKAKTLKKFNDSIAGNTLDSIIRRANARRWKNSKQTENVEEKN